MDSTKSRAEDHCAHSTSGSDRQVLRVPSIRSHLRQFQMTLMDGDDGAETEGWRSGLCDFFFFFIQLENKNRQSFPKHNQEGFVPEFNQNNMTLCVGMPLRDAEGRLSMSDGDTCRHLESQRQKEREVRWSSPEDVEEKPNKGKRGGWMLLCPFTTRLLMNLVQSCQCHRVPGARF